MPRTPQRVDGASLPAMPAHDIDGIKYVCLKAEGRYKITEALVVDDSGEDCVIATPGEAAVTGDGEWLYNPVYN